ncbi:Hsp20 family protein [Brevundimonas sp.]|uniref:Hsp20 family protein n=1 Tax=Brevundimonas sp. TaxID=1871086 RepID=UPI003AF4361C
MTTRTVLFDSPFLLGFDHTRSLIDRAARAASEAYPPYNVEQRGDAAVRITLAVAGFAPDDLSITLEGRQLTISGKRDGADKGGAGSGAENAYLHRGIAARGFLRTFVLADGLEVEDASLEHGLLHVDMRRPEQVAQTRRIPITTR